MKVQWILMLTLCGLLTACQTDTEQGASEHIEGNVDVSTVSPQRILLLLSVHALEEGV